MIKNLTKSFEMETLMENNNNAGRYKYLSMIGAWALAFGCSVGWGSFVMPGSTFLPIAGFDVYFGEILLAVGALLLGALACLRRRLASGTQAVMAIVLFIVVVVTFVIAAVRCGGVVSVKPSFSPDHTEIGGTFTIFALAPWAYVGFESISHSAGEAKFPLKKAFRIMVIALITAAITYAFLALLAVTALPEGVSSWTEYVANLGNFSGIEAQPTFHAAFAALGTYGSVILGIAALCAIFTGIIGNYIALSRLIAKMSDDEMLPKWFGKLNKSHAPSHAIWGICAVSVILPFFGRTAISWIVDVTTV